MKKLLAIIFMAYSACCFAQTKGSEKQSGFDVTNLFTGGSVSFGLGFGNYNKTFLAGVSPHFGYTFTKWLDAAVVANFQYSSVRNVYDDKFRNTTYGPGIFTRIYPVRFLFIQAQPEYNFIKQKYIPVSGPSIKDNFGVTSLLLGAGYISSRSGKNSFTYLSVLFDVLKNPYSPYVDGYGKIIPVVRAGINIGLNKKQDFRNRSQD
jgi:hypothetical protein